ncbi:MAG: beta-glucosidase BglX, partial [Planctomycetales bacterium]|nr:beta-glucosidase BglX [Planctomycetales bacterium]
MQHARLASFLIALAIAAPACAQTVAERPWLDANATSQDRAEALLAHMTLAEKIGQLWQTNGLGGEATGDADNLVAGSALYQLIRESQLGSILNETNLETINALQRVAVEESRLGIPLVFGRDVIHGHRTVFPIPLGQAASWHPELVEQACAVAAREARSRGIHWTFAPMVDIARDPRWGRIAEGFGEDPYLAGVLAAASVQGYQGDDLTSPNHIAACAKHFVGYGAAEGGRDYNTTSIAPSLLHNVYLPPFRAAVDAGVATVMSAFNDVNGVPATGNRYLLREVLREQWGFQGLVVSDWESVSEMIRHGYAADAREAARLAASAGVNMEMVSGTYRAHLPELVEKGTVDPAWIDRMVRDALVLKFRLGLFENPYVDVDAPSILLADAHLDVARRLARESMVLLKNDHDLLPLRPKSLKKLAVIGPLAEAPREQLGCWIPDGNVQDSRTPLAGIRAAVGEDVEVLYAPGLKSDLDVSDERFAHAVDTANQADAVVLIVGETAEISGEARSRASIELPGAQDRLVAALAQTGKPLVLVVHAGRPIALGRQLAAADALLFCPHAGVMAGPALADLLFGDVSPSAKLPVTLPKSTGQIPLYYNHPNTGRPPRPYDFAVDNAFDDSIKLDLGYNSNYLDVEPYPLFPFGYGLSYARFEYGAAELSVDTLRDGQTMGVRVPVINRGEVPADEVVQLYIRDVVGSVVRPVRELKAFRRIRLEPGQQEVVEFSLSTDALKFYDNEGKLLLEPGQFEIYVGGSSLAPLAGVFE